MGARAHLRTYQRAVEYCTVHDSIATFRDLLAQFDFVAGQHPQLVDVHLFS
jgi:hypothetical protein